MKVDAAYYIVQYLAGRSQVVPTAEFGFYERQAEAELSSLTMHKIDTAEITDNIKNCICAVMEYLYKLEQRGDIKSENNDGYSVTYTEETKAQKIADIARIYLPHNLLYRGCL